MASQYPDDFAIRQIMKDTGMEYIQARNHLIARTDLLAQEKSDRRFLPLSTKPVVAPHLRD